MTFMQCCPSEYIHLVCCSKYSRSSYSLSVLGILLLCLRSAVDIAVNHMIKPLYDTGISFLNRFLKPMADHVQSFIGKNGLTDYVKQLHMTVIDILKEVYQNSIAYNYMYIYTCIIIISIFYRCFS